MKSSRKHVAEGMAVDISDSLKVMTCEHEWKKYGHGYRCIAGCEYYTGMNEELNMIIHKELKERKKR